MVKKEISSTTQYAIVVLVLLNILIIYEAYTGDSDWYRLLLITMPLLLLAVLARFFRYDENNDV